jgi:SAM-dependent methyltransferase
MKLEVSCPVCDSGHYVVLYEPWVDVTDPALLYGAASGIQGTQRLVRCAGCGMIYENPRYPEDLILRGYTSSNEAGHDSQHGMRVASFLKALERLSAFIPAPGARVLDVGTAGGAFLEAAEQFGYHAVGMEPSQYLVERARTRGLTVEQGTIDNHKFPAGGFDMVTLWDVIEHLVDPKKALRQIARLLKPGGILLINFPDIGTWQARFAGRRFWWILSVHLHHFTRRTVEDICRRTGFETFHFARYWQVLEFGYLERMAIHYKVPLASLLTRMTPAFVQRIPIPYYASQTTALARRNS